MRNRRTQPRRKLASWHRFAATVLALALVFALASRAYLRKYPLPPAASVSIYCCFLLLLVLAIAPAWHAPRSALSKLLPGRGKLLLSFLCCLPYLIYAAGTHDFRWQALARLLLVALPLPAIYLLFPVRNAVAFNWQDALLGTWLIASVLFRGLHGIWNVPVNLDFISRLFLIALASWTWTIVRPVPGLGYRFVSAKQLVTAAAINFSLFALIAIPASLALGFTRWNPHWRGLAAFSLDYLEIFLFIALLEELFFRGFLQNLLSYTLRAPWRGQLVASCVFGLSHIFHAPVPNWRYVALASVAGWFYGSAFRATGSIVASSLTHALVDTAWRTWFSKM